MTGCFSLRNKRIWIAGDRGMVGSALVRRLRGEECDILTCRADLREQEAVRRWIGRERPDAVIVAAARVGGIAANSARPADFLYDNLAIATHVIHESYRAGVGKLLFLGSSCIYPREAAQPIAEEALLSGPLEPTNEWYAVAKIAGLKMCQAYRRQYGCDFIAAMPCNLYGPGDTYDARQSHVIPALLMKMHEAREAGLARVTLWGTGAPLREFMHVDDLADALLFLLTRYSGEAPVNAGSGEEVSIADLAARIARVTGYRGAVVFDPAQPDGTPRKLMDSGRLRAMGWAPSRTLDDGLADAYDWYLAHGAGRAAA